MDLQKQFDDFPHNLCKQLLEDRELAKREKVWLMACVESLNETCVEDAVEIAGQVLHAFDERFGKEGKV